MTENGIRPYAVCKDCRNALKLEVHSVIIIARKVTMIIV